MLAGGGGRRVRLAGCGGGVISAEELNSAIEDEMRDGYERSSRVMEDKLRRLYKQLGLSRDPAEILGDPYSKKSPLPSMGLPPSLAISPTDTSYRLLGQSRIQQRNTTRYNHPRIHAQ